MRVIVPALNTTLVSSSVPEPDAGESMYSAGATYGLGATVVGPASHMIYESLQAGNVGKPLPVPPETETDWWLEVGVSNRHACVDSARNTQSVGASPMTVVLAANERINSIAVMGMLADTLRIQMHNAGNLVYDQSFSLMLRRVRNGYDYCFKPFDFQENVVRYDLPPFHSAAVTLTLTRAGGPCKLGAVILGNYAYLGQVQRDSSPVNDGLNFSTIERDKYGKATLRPRRSVPRTEQTLLVEKQFVPDLLDIRERLNAVPAVWSGLDDRGSDDFFNALLILGIYKQFRIPMKFVNYAEVVLELEEI